MEMERSSLIAMPCPPGAIVGLGLSIHRLSSGFSPANLLTRKPAYWAVSFTEPVE
jgi:hypothetical protein